jgi:branched-chain amino acid aminotransferase
MPCLIRFLTPDGLQPAPYTADSLAAAAQHEPRDGVYTITNTFNTAQALKLDAHLDRMEDSARRAGLALTLDRPALRAALRTMIAEANWGDSRFRITAGGDTPERLILSLEPFQPHPASAYVQGVKCVTVADAARHNPAAKTTDWMHDRQKIEAALPPGVYTGLLVSENGAILEGLSSNFYAVLNGELRTAGEGVLPGIAQQIVFEIAPPIIPLSREAVHVNEIPALDEGFITSSSRGIMPVVEIDGVRIGAGEPGAVTRRLREAYAVWMAQHLEAI